MIIWNDQGDFVAVAASKVDFITSLVLVEAVAVRSGFYWRCKGVFKTLFLRVTRSRLWLPFTTLLNVSSMWKLSLKI